MVPHVRERPIQPDHVTGQQVELVLLELLLHQLLLAGGNFHRLSCGERERTRLERSRRGNEYRMDV